MKLTAEEIPGLMGMIEARYSPPRTAIGGGTLADCIEAGFGGGGGGVGDGGCVGVLADLFPPPKTCVASCSVSFTPLDLGDSAVTCVGVVGFDLGE